MIPYAIPPYPSMVDPDIRVAVQAFTETEVNLIRTYGDAMIERQDIPARVGFHDYSRVVEGKRQAHTQWIPYPGEDPSIRWMYDKVGHVIQQANALSWQYDIWGFYDQMHYVQYHEGGDHFGWHQDRGDDWRRPQRKLAISVLLSDESEYEGGEFQIFDGQEITQKLPKTKGSAFIFPSFVQHRVLPVTKGVRRSLIAWLAGPRFR